MGLRRHRARAPFNVRFVRNRESVLRARLTNGDGRGYETASGVRRGYKGWSRIKNPHRPRAEHPHSTDVLAGLLFWLNLRSRDH